MIKYEKPKFVAKNLRASETVADTCWGLSDGHSNQRRYLYDIEGAAHLSYVIQNADGSCGAPDVYKIEYHESKDAPGILLSPDDPIYKKYDPIIERMLINYVNRGHGNNNQNYGSIDIDLPITPDPSWS